VDAHPNSHSSSQYRPGSGADDSSGRSAALLMAATCNSNKSTPRRPPRSRRRGYALQRSAFDGRRWPVVVTGALLIWSVWTRPDIALALVLLGVPFMLFERWWPLRDQQSALRRSGAATDATGFIVDEVLAALGLAAVLVVILPVVRHAVPDEVPRYFSAQPGWFRWVTALVISEVSGYWGHRLSHEIPVLWRFHRIHHSAPQLDWLAPNRRHPIDMIVARSSTSLPVLMLGFAVPTVVTYFALKRIQGLFVHANVDFRFGPLERVVATPFFHHWHHSAEPGTWNKNYSGSIPAVDWIFGTLHLPAHWPQAYGCEANVPDSGYVARIISPWMVNREVATASDVTPVARAEPLTESDCSSRRGSARDSGSRPLRPTLAVGDTPTSDSRRA
jgi:sterol desaturase/sphingolipid hydroxylase (fatty acid hydroxylase superfamily)